MSRELNICLIRGICRADKKTVRLADVLKALEEKTGPRRIYDIYRQICERRSQDSEHVWDMDHDVLEEQCDAVLEMFAITLELIPLPDWLAPKSRGAA